MSTLSPDKLSDWSRAEAHALNELAAELTLEELKIELELRRELCAVLGRLKSDRHALGRVLSRYRDLYRPLGVWERMCEILGINPRTALRCIEDYEAANSVPADVRGAALDAGVDLAERRNRDVLLAVTEEISRMPESNPSTPEELVNRARVISMARRHVTPREKTSRAARIEAAVKAVGKLLSAFEPGEQADVALLICKRLQRRYASKKQSTSKPSTEQLVFDEVAA